MAFKMRGNPFKLGKIATKSAMKMKTSYKMKEAMAKMKSPMELKKDSPMDKYKSDAQRKAVHASKAERGMTMKKEAAMKMGHKSPAKAAKPDFPDIDGDGNTTESMKKAAADKKSAKKMKKAPMKLKKAPTKMKKKSSMKMGHKSPKKLSQYTMNPAEARTGAKPSASIRMKKTAPAKMAKKSPKKIRRGGSGVAERVLPGGKNR